jgi:hypothetical protein
MNRSNRFTSTSNNNNNNNSKGNNNRFSILNDLVTEPKKSENRKEKDKDRESSSFSKNSNSRFDSLLEESPVPSVETVPNNSNNSNNNRNQYNSFRSATIIKREEKKEEIKQPDLKEDDFPDLQLIAPVKKEPIIVNKWAAAVKKEVKVVEEEYDEDKIYVEPGWICIRKNKKTGKTETIQGPLTEEQKKYERIRYLEQHNLKYNMYKAIERMEERWNDYKTQFDEHHGQGAYQEKYGVNLSYDSDDDDKYDSDSEYEYE